MDIKPSFLEELLIVIVIFEKNPLETSAFQSLNSIREKASLMIYDNSFLPSQVEVENTIYLHDSSNPGVSKAYNIASTFAKSRDKKWLMLVDQDTQFPDCFFEKYQMAINAFPDIQIFVPLLTDYVGLVSPFTFRYGKGDRIKIPDPGVYDLSKFRFMNSGLVVATEAFEAVDGYDERFPLDHSDIVFTDRLTQFYGYFIIVDVQCHHQFSGNDRIPSIRRFNIFCQAALLYKKTVSMNVPLYWVLLPRAIKLSLQTRNFQFFKVAWMAFLKG